MEKGARQRSHAEKSKPGAGEPEPGADSGSGGGGVALKKEIGLVSACGIIVGKSDPFSHPVPRRWASLVVTPGKHLPVCPISLDPEHLSDVGL